MQNGQDEKSCEIQGMNMQEMAVVGISWPCSLLALVTTI